MNHVIYTKKQELYAHFKNYIFWIHQISFLGHIVSKERIIVGPKKVESVILWQIPKNVSEARSFSNNQDIIKDLLKVFQE